MCTGHNVCSRRPQLKCRASGVRMASGDIHTLRRTHGLQRSQGMQRAHGLRRTPRHPHGALAATPWPGLWWPPATPSSNGRRNAEARALRSWLGEGRQLQLLPAPRNKHRPTRCPLGSGPRRTPSAASPTHAITAQFCPGCGRLVPARRRGPAPSATTAGRSTTPPPPWLRKGDLHTSCDPVAGGGRSTGGGGGGGPGAARSPERGW